MEIKNQKKEIGELAMSSKDVASKLSLAEKYIHNVIEENNPSDKEVVEILKELVKALDISGKEKDVFY